MPDVGSAPALKIADILKKCWNENRPAGKPKLVFIVGAPRTGTTMLNALISSIDGVMPAVPEISPFLSIIEAYQKNSRLEALYEGAFFGGLAGLKNAYHDFLESIIRGIQTRNGGGLPVLKQPMLAKHLHVLMELFPEAVFICTVRHPVFILRSMRRWGKKAVDAGRTHFYHTATDEEIYHEIHTYYTKAFSIPEQWAQRLRFVRYEDIVRQSPEVLTNLMKFIGCPGAVMDFQTPYKKMMIDFDQLTDQRADAITEMYGKAVDLKKLKKDIKSLTGPEIALAQKSAKALMTYFYKQI